MGNNDSFITDLLNKPKSFEKDFNIGLMENGIDQLREAIKEKNKKKILKVYEIVSNDVELEKVPDALFQEWDYLIDKANTILFS
jgi:hypothetical protein